MKILQIMAGNEEGGLEKHFVELCNRLSETYEVYVIAHEKYKERFSPKISFYTLDLAKGRRNPLILFRLSKMINRINPDILHAHANKAVEMVTNIQYFLHSHIKRIATLHSQKKNVKSFNQFDYVIGVSNEVLKDIRNPHQSVVYNGIVWEERERIKGYLGEQFGIEGKVFTICGIGRIELVKNFALLISSIKDLEVKLLIVGEGDQEKELRSLVKKLQIEDKVIFAGYREDAVNIILHSDLFVISSDKEGLPYVLIEALLCEIPVISTDVSDVKRILPDFAVVPVGDKERLSQTIVNVKENYVTAKEEYQKSFNFAKEHFTIEAMVDGVESVYREVSGR